MAIININNLNMVTANIPGISNVSYNYINRKTTAICPISKVTGVFTSEVITVSEEFVRWASVEWEGIQTDLNVAIYIKYDKGWEGPYYNKSFDINSYSKQIQFMVVMTTDGTYFPKIDKLSIKYLASSSSVKFYTKAFDLGFKPETVLLTYNGSLNNDTIARFFISGDDSIDPIDYQQIAPNKIETLNSISIFSTQIKVMLELIGPFNTEVNISEFAINVGGDSTRKINKVS